MTNDTNDDETTDKGPSKELIHQYEAVRQSGHINMLAQNAVQRFAEMAGMDELANCGREEYMGIIEWYQRNGRPTSDSVHGERVEGGIGGRSEHETRGDRP